VGISLAGLSSGLDTNSIIDQLMAVETQPRTLLANKQTAAQARQDGYNAINSKLTLLNTAASSLSSVLTWNAVQTASTSDPSLGTATITAGAGPGSYAVQVTQLATSEQRTFAINDAGQAATVQVNGQNFDINADETVDDIASRLNSDPSFGVYAVNSGGKLVLAGRATGTPITLTRGGSVAVEDPTKLRSAKQALYSIDGTSYSSATNTISDTSGAPGFVSGVQMTLKGPGTFSLDVSPPGVDQDAVVNAVKGWVSAYNDALDLMQKSVTEQKVVNPSSDADIKKGALWSDNTVQDLMQSMRSTISGYMATGNSTLYDELAEMGISTGAPSGSGTFSQDSVNGKLVFDETKLRAALDTDPTAVQRMFAGVAGGTGFGQAFTAALSPYTEAGGLMQNSIDSAGSEISDLKDSIAAMDERLALKQQSLQTMFTNLEVNLQKVKSQGSDLLAQLGTTSTSTSS
jgi:flagellar hook-associated protein 2